MFKTPINTIIRLCLTLLFIAIATVVLPDGPNADAAPLLLSASTADAYSSGFTYQGTLRDAEQPANGVYDFRFQVLADGGAVGAEFEAENVSVADGLFAVTIPVTGSGIWNGQRRHLSVAARRDGESEYVVIGTPTEIQPAPYAFHARSASRALEAATADTLTNIGSSVLQVGTFNMFQGGPNPSWEFAARGTGMMEVTTNTGDDIGFVYLPVDVPAQILGFNQKLSALSFCYSGADDNGIGVLAGFDLVQIRQVDKFNQTTLLNQQYDSYQSKENECVTLTLDTPASVNGSLWIMFRTRVSNAPLKFGEIKLTFVNG